MAFQFPANPTTGDIFTAAPGVQYRWTGVAWCPFATQFPGVPIFQNPALFADGTQALPGIAWANEPNSGFTRTGADTFRSMVTGKNVFSWNKTGIYVEPDILAYLQGPVRMTQTLTTDALIRANGSVTIPCGSSYYARNPANTADWPVLHASTGNSLHICWNGFDQCYIYGGGGVRLQTHGGGVVFNGTLSGGRIDASLNGPATHVYNDGSYGDGTTIRFAWWDDGSNVSYLWGGDSSARQRVIPPGRLSVNYANSCNQANRVGGAGGWNYANWDNNPTYVWATNGDGNTQFLAHRPSLSVNDSTHHEGHRVYQLCRSENSWAICGMNGDNMDYLLMRRSDSAVRWVATNDDHTVIGLRVFWDDGNQSHMLYFRGDAGGFAARCSSYSDERLKRDVGPTTVDASEVVKAMGMFSFNWKRPDSTQRTNLGFSAQNLQALDPSLVFAVPQPTRLKPEELPPDAPPLPEYDATEGLSEILTVNTDKVLAYTVKAVQEILVRLDKLENRA